MSKHVTPRRLGVGALVAATATLAGAPLAGAATQPPELYATAKLTPRSDVDGLVIGLDDGRQERTILFGLVDDHGAALKTYCVEYRTPRDVDHPDMVEAKWDEYPDPQSPFLTNSGKIHWILQHSYPRLGLDEVEEALGGTFDNGLSAAEAIAATQGAIWSFSDGVGLDSTNPTPDDPESADDVRALYEYLTGDENVGDETPPQPELGLAPETLRGVAGTAIGPFEVTTTAESAQVSSRLPDGVTLVDETGRPLGDTVSDADSIFVDVPVDAAAGSGIIRVKAHVERNVGRLFIGAKYKKHPTQSMILADSAKTKVRASAEVSWKAAPRPTRTPTPTPTSSVTPTPSETPTPTDSPTTPAPSTTPPPPEQPTPAPELPDTGASPSLPVLIGLSAVGAAALLLRRRFVGAEH